MPEYDVVHGDCMAVLSDYADKTFDAVVTDPPYGLKFMGREWDHGVPGALFWEEILRTSKPGAHLLAFGGTRTYHRLVCAIEDAGWEIIDCVAWMYSSGFPKSQNVSKMLDKDAGADREVVGRYKPPQMKKAWNLKNAKDERTVTISASSRNNLDITAASTAEAKKWDGYGTALKPAWEPIILARRPLEGRVIDNVRKYGTGCMDIDGCRIEYTNETDKDSATPQGKCTAKPGALAGKTQHAGARSEFERPVQNGRWPANVVLSHDPRCVEVGRTMVLGRHINRFTDGAKPFGGGAGHPYTSEALPDEAVPVFACVPGCPVRTLDEQAGRLKSGSGNIRKKAHKTNCMAGTLSLTGKEEVSYGDEGGASRFFYCSKASKKERNAGMEEGKANVHPTVKPVDLMRWLVRLATPPGGTVLDPFMGSGSTGVAAALEGRGFIGIDIEEESCGTAVARIEHALSRTEGA